MEILIVDDQAAVVNGIEQKIPWESIGILKVWKAYNALEAKTVIQKENIDILLCDIEMPEENGLSLCRWIKQNGYEMECVLLTAHADFEFAREAVSLGVFDYILQPARYEEIQDVLLKVKERINEKRQVRNFSDLGKLFHSKKQVLLADIIKRWVWEKDIGIGEVIRELSTFGYSLSGENVVCCSLIQIMQWNEESKKLANTLFSFVTGNIIQELLAEFPVLVICSCLDKNILSCLTIGDKESVPQIQDMRRQLARYLDIVFQLYSCKVACFLDDITELENVAISIINLDNRRLSCEKIDSKIYFQGDLDENEKNLEPLFDKQDMYVEEVVRYIRCNIERPLNRVDIAKSVNLSEDYLTHLFKYKKGISLKKFIIQEKMAVAKRLLQSTDLPIGIIAAEVGYDNFSHFSSTYRAIMGISPMEERN